jgi:hypothetical protein
VASCVYVCVMLQCFKKWSIEKRRLRYLRNSHGRLRTSLTWMPRSFTQILSFSAGTHGIWIDAFQPLRIYWILLCYVSYLFYDVIWFLFRRILLFPKGNDVDNSLSIYFEAMQTANMSKGWSRDVKFKLLVFNQLDANITVIRGRASPFHYGWK